MFPAFNHPTVLVDDQFDYVEMWLKRNAKDALVYWTQTENFFRATKAVTSESSPLTAYYCILNATKTLLAAKGLSISHYHGVSGKVAADKTALRNEIVNTQGAGVFIDLSSYFGADLRCKEVCLRELFYNIPFIHRAFTVTYTSSKNLFIPISDAHFARQSRGNESWFCAQVKDKQYQKSSIWDSQRGWEVDRSEDGKFFIRRKKRFKWISRGPDSKTNEERLRKYHVTIRRDVRYIHSAQRLWYYKRNDKSEDVLNWPTLSLIFAAMHRLSELCRYDPNRLLKHFSTQHNWLLTEFLSLAIPNFVDQIACEITGQDIMTPGYR